jgi:hypothetical protein
MSRLPRKILFENDLSSVINSFFISFNIGNLLKTVGAYKTKGIPVIDIFKQLFTLVFMHKSLFEALRSNETNSIAKDTFYRLLNSCNINWRRFVHLLAGRIICEKLENLTAPERVNVFIVDDTLYERKRSSKGEKLSVMEIYRRNQKRRGCSRYLLSVTAEILGKDGAVLPVRLVYVRKRGKRKEYLVLLSTDTLLSEEEIIRIYGKRWQIEVFFKVCKSLLRLAKECHSTSYDAMVAWNAIVMSRYMMLALDKRLEEDTSSFGELFYDICNELPDITWRKAFLLLLDTLLNVVAEKYFLADDEVEYLLGAFMDALPEMWKKSLLQCA